MTSEASHYQVKVTRSIAGITWAKIRLYADSLPTVYISGGAGQAQSARTHRHRSHPTALIRREHQPRPLHVGLGARRKRLRVHLRNVDEQSFCVLPRAI